MHIDKLSLAVSGGVLFGIGTLFALIVINQEPDPDRLALMSMMASLAPLLLTAGATLLALVNAIEPDTPRI